MAWYNLGLIYVLVGAAVCLSIIAISDWRSATGAIFIYDGCDITPRQRFSAETLLSMLKAAEEKNNEIFVIKGLAMTKAEILDCMCRCLGISSQKAYLIGDELIYSLESAERNGLANLDGRFVTLPSFEDDAVAARRVYELWISAGGVRPINGMKRFLEANGILLLDDLRWLTPVGNTVLLSEGEGSQFQSMLNTFSYGNAILLLSALNGSLRVMQC